MRTIPAPAPASPKTSSDVVDLRKPVALVPPAPVAPAAPVAPLAPPAPKCETFNTSVDFAVSPAAAEKQAAQDGKLVFLLHVSGDFEDDAFT